MKQLKCIIAVSAFVSMMATGQPNPSSMPAPDCPITQTSNGGSYYANDALGATLPGKLVFAPDGPGFVDYDGALGIKFAFERHRPGRLFVGGRRLDGEAASARAYIYDYGDRGFQPIYLVFPTPGCWEITGGVGGATLTFVLLVERIGAGPSWRQNGPPPGRRVTMHWREQ